LAIGLWFAVQRSGGGRRAVVGRGSWGNDYRLEGQQHVHVWVLVYRDDVRPRHGQPLPQKLLHREKAVRVVQDVQPRVPLKPSRIEKAGRDPPLKVVERPIRLNRILLYL